MKSKQSSVIIKNSYNVCKRMLKLPQIRQQRPIQIKKSFFSLLYIRPHPFSLIKGSDLEMGPDPTRSYF